MDSYSLVKDIVCCLWACGSTRYVYIRELPERLNSLENAMKDLKDVYTDVMRKVEREEEHKKKKRTSVVSGWMESVEAMETEVNDFLAKGRAEIQKKFLGTCCVKNCRASYKIGEKVPRMIDDVNSKMAKGQNFIVVAEPLPPPAVIVRPLDTTVDVDLYYDQVCKNLRDEKVTKVGLCGIEDVSKTTLLTKINNEFLPTIDDFNVAIWVTVSRAANVKKIQQDIFERLQIPDNEWRGRSEERRKQEIFSVLQDKTFLLLLDDVWEPLDHLLGAVGIPPLHGESKSKVILTTRDLKVCQGQGAKVIHVKKSVMEDEDPFAWFQKYAGGNTLSSHSQIKQLTKGVALFHILYFSIVIFFYV